MCQTPAPGAGAVVASTIHTQPPDRSHVAPLVAASASASHSAAPHRNGEPRSSTSATAPPRAQSPCLGAQASSPPSSSHSLSLEERITQLEVASVPKQNGRRRPALPARALHCILAAISQRKKRHNLSGAAAPAHGVSTRAQGLIAPRPGSVGRATACVYVVRVLFCSATRSSHAG